MEQSGLEGGEAQVPPGFAEGAKLVGSLAEAGDLPDALLCASDMVAVGALQACLGRGLREPEDIGICAFDGTELTAVTQPAITSLDYPLERVAEAGATEIRRLAETPGGPIRRLEVDAQVQMRHTT
jgi:LacI family transcriptional regulator